MKKQNKVLGMKLTYLTMLLLLICSSCNKDCPDGITYSYKTYTISENAKQTFPYHFKDTQVWINVNTNDTLHYILKDTVSSLDTLLKSPTDGCVQNNYTYNGTFTYKFNCLEDSLFDYKIKYNVEFDPYLFFNNMEYSNFYPLIDSILNYNKIYYKVFLGKYFSDNKENGVVRITINSTKLYRIN